MSASLHIKDIALQRLSIQHDGQAQRDTWPYPALPQGLPGGRLGPRPHCSACGLLREVLVDTTARELIGRSRVGSRFLRGWKLIIGAAS